MSTNGRIEIALQRWAAKHPDPFTPALHISGTGYTPRELAEEVEKHTPRGRLIVQIIKNGAARHSLDEVLAMFQEPKSNSH